MSIFDINFSLQWKNLLPPSKRSQEFLDWGTALLSPLQWLRDLFFVGYANGDTASLAYNPATAYTTYSRVRFNNRIYWCYVAPPAAGYDPTNTAYWIQIQADWRGANERLIYNGQKLILEYVLNRWFGTTFNQPSTGLNSTYWIQTLVTNDDTFFIHQSGASYVSVSPAFQKSYIKSGYTFQPFDFQVNFPASATAGQITQMKSLVSQYKLYGTKPNYVSY